MAKGFRVPVTSPNFFARIRPKSSTEVHFFVAAGLHLQPLLGGKHPGTPKKRAPASEAPPSLGLDAVLEDRSYQEAQRLRLKVQGFDSWFRGFLGSIRLV